MSFGIYHRPSPGTRTPAPSTEPMRHRCAFDMTAAELASVTSRATCAGLTACEYVRAVVLNTEPALADILTAARLTRGLARGILREQAKTPAARDAADRLADESTAVVAAIERAAAMIGVRLE